MSPVAGLALGAVAAVCWGLADFFVAVVARKHGPIKVLCVMTIGALALYSGVYLIVSPGMDYPLSDVALIAGMAVALTATYISFYKGLQIGPVAIVAPIVAAYSAIVVLLAFLFLGERLSVLQTSGAVVALLGVVLASADVRELKSSAPRIGMGVVLGVIALFGFGTTTFLGGFLAQKYDFIGPALLGRVFLTVFFYTLGAIRSELPSISLGPKAWGLILLLGAMEGAGYLAFSKGAEIGLVSIVAVATASYPVIPLILGITILKERIAPNQWVGVATVLGGVALLSV